MTSWNDFAAFKVACDNAGIPVPEPLLEGMRLREVAHAHTEAPMGPLLSLTDDEIRDRVEAHAIRIHDKDGIASQRGMTPGIAAVTEALRAEVRIACAPYLDAIIDDLKPSFDEAAGPLVIAAQQYGFTYRTKSDEVVLLDHDAIDAWRAARDAHAAIIPFARLRIAMSRAFAVSPSAPEARNFFRFTPALNDTGNIDHSVAFAAGDNWSLDGKYYLDGNRGGHLDWLALAAGGLSLNTPSETREKLVAKHPGFEDGIPDDNDDLDNLPPRYPR